METIEIQSGLIGKKIQAHVVLPPCFDRNLPGGYPVLYLLHGQSYTHDHWLDLGVASVAADSINRGEAKPFVIVLPREEYYLEDLPGSHFGDALVNEVIPWIDDHYPTCTQRSCRALGGISRGAVWAVRLGLTHPELFGATGAHSLPAAPYSEYRLAALIKEINANYPMRFYIDSGVTDTYIREAIAFEALLTKYRLPHTWVLGQGTHNDAYWMSQVSNYLSWYTLGWRSDGNS